MRNDKTDFSEITPEMIEHYMEQARKMRAQQAQHIVNLGFFKLSRIADKIASTVMNTARAVIAALGKIGKLRSADPASP